MTDPRQPRDYPVPETCDCNHAPMIGMMVIGISGLVMGILIGWALL